MKYLITIINYTIKKEYKILVILGFYCNFITAQIPENYYNTTRGLTGKYLKTALYNLIKGHKQYPYTSTSTDVWDILKMTDKDPKNPNNVILIHSGWSVNAAQEFNNGNGWTREHIWAKSHGDFGTELGAGTDIHHIRPENASINSARNNLDYDNGGSIYFSSQGATECRKDNDSWETRNAVKGDVARMLFYMAVRYEGDGNEPDLELVNSVNTFTLNQIGKGFHGKLSTLLSWHKFDPVDSFEIKRNNIIYSYQLNRNPFIDNPTFVDLIWGSATSSESIDLISINIFPNPSNEQITISYEKPFTAKIFSAEGRLIKEVINSNQPIFITELNNGLYIIQITSDKGVFIEKFIKN